MKKTILIVALAFVLGLALGLAINNFFPTGKAIEQKSYSYTRAICNEGKCIDIFVQCENGKVLSLKPISELKDFSDVNAELNTERFCD